MRKSNREEPKDEMRVTGISDEEEPWKMRGKHRFSEATQIDRGKHRV